MKFSYSWLKQLVDIPIEARKLAEFLSLHAFETEVANSGQEFPNIIVAKVTKVEKHPNADRLRIIELTDGKNKIGPVVCGAWNFEEGVTVALALPGAVIPHDQHDPEGKPFTLTKATIRGIESQGMICSAKELGLGTEGRGIMVLDSSYKPGQPFAARKQSEEILFDISVPANRPDLISYRGVAWEIAALTGKKYLAKPIKSQISHLKSQLLKVRISDLKLCQKYLAARFTNVKISPSPKFIQDRLLASGLRPINNVVDITNYVMLEVGQPLHAFDAAKVTGAVNVRQAYMQESITTLDGVKRKLASDTLVIADAKKVLAIAGVMGGADSAVSENTTEIILEAANFNAVSVRRTSQALGLRTDASSRFEKSLPIAFARLGLEYAGELLEKYAGAKPMESASAGSKSEKPRVVSVDPAKINQLLGTNILAAEQKKILEKFGFEVLGSGSAWKVTVPFWRSDVSIWQDLAEEVSRFKGLDFIKPQKTSFPLSGGMTDPAIYARDNISNLLAGMGFDEAYTYSSVSENFFQKYGIDPKNAVEIANPISADLKYLRLGLGMNYEKLIEQNSRHADEECLFEIGNVYRQNNGHIDEHTNLFMICFSKKTQPAPKLIGSMRELSRRLGIEMEIKQADEETGEVYFNGEKNGPIRAVNDETKWAAAELNFDKLIKHIKPLQYRSISRYPAKELDVAVLVREDLPWGEIKKTILAANQKLVSEVRLFDVYQGKNITPGKKSLAFRIVYQAPDRTLTDDEVNKVHRQILDLLKQKFSAHVRD
jgi:phenylalanyl-tRNA synthetase beta chain